MARFYLGQPVLCINGKPFAGAARDFPGIVWPTEGVVYRVRAIYAPIRTQVARARWQDLTFILLCGLKNEEICWPHGMVAEAAFFEGRFQPATDIDSLHDINTNIKRFMGTDGPRVDTKRRKKHRKKENA